MNSEYICFLACPGTLSGFFTWFITHMPPNVSNECRPGTAFKTKNPSQILQGKVIFLPWKKLLLFCMRIVYLQHLTFYLKSRHNFGMHELTFWKWQGRRKGKGEKKSGGVPFQGTWNSFNYYTKLLYDFNCYKNDITT